MELILVRLSCVENFHIAVLHPYRQPVSGRAVTKAEYLAAKVMLLELSTLPEIP